MREEERESVSVRHLYMFLQRMAVIHSSLLKNVSPLNKVLTVLMQRDAPGYESVT